MRQDRFSSLLGQTCLVGSLLGFAATLSLVAGLAGYLGAPLVNITVSSAPLLGALFFIVIFFFLMPAKGWLRQLTWFLILGILVAEVVLGLVPPVARDELTHHLAIPKLYASSGKILQVPFAPYSYYPMLLDMLYVPFVRWGWDSIPKLVHGLYAFLTGLLLYAYCSRRLSPVYGLLGFFLYISTPAVLRLSNVAYVDLGLVFYSTAALLCLLLWMESGYPPRWLMLAGISAGFALATKPNGLLVLLLLLSLLAFRLGRERSAGQVLSWLFLFFIFALLPYSPWLWKNWSQTGNPLFPFFTALFGSGGAGGGLGAGVGGGSLGIFTKRQLLYGESGWWIAALPLRIFFSGQDNSPQYFDGVLNPILIVFLPWAFGGKWVGEKRLLFSFALLYLVYAVFLVDMRIRYILPIIPPLVILIVYAVHNIYLRIVHPSLLAGAIVFLVALNGVYLWGYFRIVSPIGYIRGTESRESYLTRMLPDYPAIRFINQNLPLTAKVYFILMGRRVYYCMRDYFHDPGDNPAELLRAIRSAKSDEEIGAGLRGKGLTHLLVREDLLKRFLRNNLSSQQQRLWGSFVTRHLRGLFSQRGYTLYQLHD